MKKLGQIIILLLIATGPISADPLLAAVGFTATGIAKGSAAAAVQSYIYGAYTCGVFSAITSAGMTGTAVAGPVGAVVGGAIAAVGYLFWI